MNIYIPLIVLTITLFLFVRNIFILFFSMENYKLHKKRLRQLQFKTELSKEESMKDLVEKITAPGIKFFIPKIKPESIEETEKTLKFVGWDEKINAKQFISLKWTLRIVGTIAFLLLRSASLGFALIWAIPLFFAPGFFLKNANNEKKQALLLEFPDFIRVTQGYVSAGMSFSRAATEGLKYLGPEWQSIMKSFISRSETVSLSYALTELSNEVEIFEVKEFVSLIKLFIDQGGSVKEGFDSQATEVQEMLHDVLVMKIEKRRIYAILVQGPILLCILAAFALPTLSSMMSLTGM